MRQGFFDDAMVEAVIGKLPAALQPVVRFAYVTGWRVQSEVLPLEWRHVDRKVGEVRLEPGTTKNQAGPSVSVHRCAARALGRPVGRARGAREGGHDLPVRVPAERERDQRLSGAWTKACTAAGYPGKIAHDLRRSAVRNMERAGLSRSVAMQLTGHKTEAVYRRYAITSEADLREGVSRLNSRGNPSVGRQAG